MTTDDRRSDPARIRELTLTESAALIRGRLLSPLELVDAYLGQIERLESQLHAWVTVDSDGARHVARDRMAQLDRGDAVGDLLGVPIGVKDIFHTRGLRTTGGSHQYRDFVPAEDAAVVARLRAAGAIVLGKTVTTEFAHADPPPTTNPWNAAHTPGGSSSGSAVAVSALMCAAAIGSQTGGSTLRPASYNGIVGFKPLFGQVSRYGMMPVSPSLDTVGVLTRSVADAAALFSALAGHDPRDPATAPDRRAARDRRTAVERGPRFGVVRDHVFGRCDEDVAQATEASLEIFARAGGQISPVLLALDVEEIDAAHTIIDRVELAAQHAAAYRTRPADFGVLIRANIAQGLAIDPGSYAAAQRVRARVRVAVRTSFAGVDALVTPATPTAAPRDLSTTGDASFQRLWSFCGLPALTIPSGLGRAGLPLGIQLVSAPRSDELLLALGRWCERQLGVSLVPPVARSP